MTSSKTDSQQLDLHSTPIKQQQHGSIGTEGHGPCPYGSPVGGLCSAGPAPAASPAVPYATSSRSHLKTGSGVIVIPTVKTGSLFGMPQPAAHLSSSEGPAASMSWTPGRSTDQLTRSTSSMPEVWQQQAMGQGAPTQQPNVSNQSPAADSTPSRDQRFHVLHHHSPAQRQQLSKPPHQALVQHSQHQSIGNTTAQPQAYQQQTVTAGIDLLLAPLLPSADEGKVLERLSQLRQALNEQRNVAAGWEQQAVMLQQALAEGQQENLTMQGQLVALQHNITLLGGNLQGRLSMVQGAVLAQLQTHLADKDTAIAASTRKLSKLQAEVERLSCGFACKLAAEQAERERLSAEASQARLLCQARGRQLTELQQEMQRLQQAAATQQQTASAGADLQQQQLEQLHHKVQELEQDLLSAQQAASAAVQQVSAAEGGRAGLRQQVEELQSVLAEKQLQIEWLEGKVADMESSDVMSQMKRHSAEVSRLQTAAAAERAGLEQQVSALRDDLAALREQDEQRQQQLDLLEQDYVALQQQLLEQQAADKQHTDDLQRMLQSSEAELQRLEHLDQQETHAATQSSSWPTHQQQQSELAAAMASDSEGADDVQGGVITCQQQGLTTDGSGDQLQPGTPATTAVEHALRAQLGIANAEVARLRHELDVARAATSEERQLTGAEIMRLQQELSEAAASASSASATAAAAVAGDAEVTSQQKQPVALQNGSDSWHSMHDGAATTQQLATGPAAGCDDVSAQYEARLQDQAETITSLQQQLKQQQQVLATLRRPERRVYDSAASRSSWVDMLQPDDDSRNQLAATATAVIVAQQPHKAALAADAAVQTDCSPTESAGSTAAAAAAAAIEDDKAEFTSPTHGMGKGRQQWPQQRAGVGDVWGDAAAGSALLSAARQEIQRLQELNQQLLHSHAEELKSSVSLEAARRALSEAKAHCKARAAAVLLASNKTWQDRLAAVKEERQQLVTELQRLKQHEDQQGYIVNQYEAAVADVQQQLGAAHAHIQQLQRQLADLADSHAQELDQVRMDVEAEAAAAMLDAGVAVARRSLQHQQQMREAAVQVSLLMPAVLLDAAVQTEQQQQCWQSGVAMVQQILQPGHTGPGCSRCVAAQDQQPRGQQGREQLQKPAAAVIAERPCTPQPAPETPAAAVAAAIAAGGGTAADSLLAAAVLPEPSAAAAAGSAAADSFITAAADGGSAVANSPTAYVQHWHAASDAADDDMCRMSSASDTPASNSSKLQASRSRLPPLAAPSAKGSSNSSEYGDCHSNHSGTDQDAAGRSEGATPPSSAAAVKLPELQPSNSPVTASSRISLLEQQHDEQQQSVQAQLLQRQGQGPQQQQQSATAAPDVNRLSSWHVELLQQQAQLDQLRMRLSQHQQHKQPTVLSQQQQHGQRSSSGGRLLDHHGSPSRFVTSSNLLSSGSRQGAGLSSAAAAGVEAAGSSRALAAAYVPSLRSASPVLEPVAGGSSPLTVTQRRQQREQLVGTAPGANLWNQTPTVYRNQVFEPIITSDHSSGSYVTALAAGDTPSAVSANTTSAQQTGFALFGRHCDRTDARYISTDTRQTAERPTTGRSTPGSDTPRVYSNSLYQEQDSGHAAAAGGSSSFFSLGRIAAAGDATPDFDTCPSHGIGIEAAAQHNSMGGVRLEGANPMPDPEHSPSGSVGGLGRLRDDVMDALSLSRYHRDRSKQQEARAKQHALNAQDALTRAAAVRSSMLSATSPAAATSCGTGAGTTTAHPGCAGVGAAVLPHNPRQFGSAGEL